MHTRRAVKITIFTNIDAVSGIAGAMAVANSVTNPFVFLLFNVKWPCCLPSAGKPLLSSRVPLNDPAGIGRCRPCTDSTTDGHRQRILSSSRRHHFIAQQ